MEGMSFAFGMVVGIFIGDYIIGAIKAWYWRSFDDHDDHGAA